MGRPFEGRKRTWRFRLNESTTLEVSAPNGATERQIRRRGRVSLVLGAIVAAVAFAAVAYADNLDDTLAAGSVTNPTINEGASFSTTINYQVQRTGSNNTSFPATVNFALSGAPSWVSLNVSSRAFSGYLDVQSVTVSGTAPSGSGGTTYNFTVEPSTSAGNLNPNPAKVDMSVTVSAPAPSDTTAPNISYVLSPASPDGNNGWYVNDVTLTWTVTENESPGSLVKTGCVDQNITADQAETTYSCSATSDGGSAGPLEVKIKRDATDPTLNPSVSPDPVVLNGTATASANASDAMSGVFSSSCDPVDTSTVGTHTVTCSAEDYAGNTNSAVASYSVIYDFHGFFRPVDNQPGVNVAKAGSAIPVKFDLSGNQGLAIFAVNSPSSVKVACDAGGDLDPVEETVTAGGSSLNYDSTVNVPYGQYIYVWKTDKAWAGTCRRLDVKLNDGTTHSANFKFTK